MGGDSSVSIDRSPGFVIDKFPAYGKILAITNTPLVNDRLLP
jgi:hypothetical protein